MILDQIPNVIFISSEISDGNMSLRTGPPNEALLNRKIFFKNIGIPEKSVAIVNQIHSTRVINTTKDYLKRSIVDADSLITNESGIYLMIKIADCLCLGLFDFRYKALGLTHIGRLGLDKKIIKKTILAMQKQFGTNPKDLIVQFSPSIGPCHYGGPPKLRQNPKWRKYISKDADENHGVNLWKMAEDQLIENGVLKRNIFNPKVCTFESKEYFSHRRVAQTGEPDFRFATILGIR